ncbi:MAG: adenylate/guanylate cyclase domain-containing protein [Pseudomonadota bacterium]
MLSRFVERLKRHGVRVGLGLIVVLFFLAHVSGFNRVDAIDRLEYFAYDARLLLGLQPEKDQRVVIVDIDERSLSAEGRWPWGRDKVARLITRLFEDYQAGLVGFDVVFAEPDESSGLGVLEQLAAGSLQGNEQFRAALDGLRPNLQHDVVLARTLAKYPVVLGYYFSETQQAEQLQIGKLPQPAFGAKHFEGRKIPFMSANGYGANLNILQDAALGAGHFNPYVDEDGVVRKVPMLYKYKGDFYESLSLAMARLALNEKQIIAGFPEDSRPGSTYQGMEWLEVGPRQIPVDERVRALVPYRGRQGSFTYVSATDVLNGTADKTAFERRIVLVGTSAPGLQDLRSTPVDEVYPGVEIHANLIAGIIDDRIMEDPAYTLGAEFIVTLLTGLIMAVAIPLLSPLLATFGTLLLLTGIVVVNIFIWRNAGMVFELSSGVLMILVMFLLNMSYGYFVESRGKRQLAGLFGQYVPPELVDEMSVDPAHYSMEAESREMTVLFTDVRGFTTISEGLDPKELSALMNEFLTPMTDIIHRRRGTIDKYMGDAIMCFWGAPLRDRDHARHATEAALEMVEAVRALGPAFKERGWPEVRIGVGVNTGEMSVGNMGSEFRLAYTVLGDAVNLGSRLEGQTKNYGVEVIVSETTKAELPDHAFLELDRIIVKGKDEPVTVYEPLGPKEQLTEQQRKEIRQYRDALKLYRAQSWDQAEIQFLNLDNLYPDRRLYALYVERIQLFRADPPGDGWDGAFRLTTK